MTEPAPRIEGFEVGPAIGAGSMGRVYRARRTATSETLAVKVLVGAATPRATARFEREIEAASRIEHEAVVGVHARGATDDGRLFYAMDLVEGRSLLEAFPPPVADGEPLRRAVGSVAKIARALHAGHRLGVVHRDVKPSHIIIDDVVGQPHLLDFGLAALVDAAPLTTGVAVVGSPAYVPPEVARGEVARADARGDLWALGVTLFELVAGRTPFAGAGSLDVLLARIGAEDAPPLDEAAGRAVPARLVAAVGRALARDPARRPASAAALADELEAWLEDRPAPNVVTTDAPTDVAPPDESQLAVAVEAARALITPEVVRLIRDMAHSPSAETPSEAPSPPSLPLSTVFGKLLAADLELPAMLDVVLDLVLAATGAREGFILVADDDGRLTLERGRGIDSRSLAPELCSSILERVQTERAAVIALDARSDARFAEQASVVQTGLRSIAAIPILAEASPTDDTEGGDAAAPPLLGAIYLQDRERAGRFGRPEQALLADLATLVEGPIRRARRYDAERRAHAEARRALASRGGRRRPPPRTRLVGRSEAVQTTLRELSRAAAASVPVLIVGESGTGKELAARIVHESSARRDGAFVAESCAALSESLLEAELFGVERGAFTGADRDRPGLIREAHGGTLFLDEVGELTPASQTKLLRVIQEGEVRPVGGSRAEPVDLRLVTATHRDLGALVEAGTFREDLYYRLNVLPVRIPPLRERRNDIPLLAEHFLEEIAAEKGIPTPTLLEETRRRLQEHDWPGNIRELRNVIQRILAIGEDGAPWADARAASPETRAATRPSGPVTVDLESWAELPSLKDARLEFERRFLEAILDRFDGNVTRAAEAIGMARSNLSRTLTRLGVGRERR